ncbi:MAG: hypothetical protein U7M05_04695, partial [Candidatus Igneacidithiobacillus chanchocoensis]
ALHAPTLPALAVVSADAVHRVPCRGPLALALLSRRVAKAKWLSKLYNDFYRKRRYHDVRKLLDYIDDENYDDLKNKLVLHTDIDLEEKVVDYLNFFHFIFILVETGQITVKDVRSMFKYYISLLGKHDIIRNYMVNEGFEKLLNFVDEVDNEK